MSSAVNTKDAIIYYSKKDVQESILEVSKDREVVGTLKDGRYLRRPNVLVYPNDIAQLARDGCVEFHGSVEHWTNPMAIKSGNYDEIRKGWDLVLDIDAKVFEHSKYAVELIAEVFKRHGVKNFGIKFSGRRGFHMIIPWKAFPQKINYKNTNLLYPELLRIIANYVRSQIEEDLWDKLSEHGIGKLIEETEKTPEELSPFEFVEVEKDWGARHLFRLPYSLHRKSGNVTYPVKLEEVKNFKTEDAKPSNIEFGRKYIPEAEEGEAELLVIEALDWHSRQKPDEPEKKEKSNKKIKSPIKRIEEEDFPPSIKYILDGLSDGRKRSVFILITFFRGCGWDFEEIEERLYEWNKENKPALPRNYIDGQLRWFARQNRKILPPNYDSNGFYKDMNIPIEKEVRTNAKNPLVYAHRMAKNRKKRKKK